MTRAECSLRLENCPSPNGQFESYCGYFYQGQHKKSLRELIHLWNVENNKFLETAVSNENITLDYIKSIILHFVENNDEIPQRIKPIATTMFYEQLENAKSMINMIKETIDEKIY